MASTSLSQKHDVCCVSAAVNNLPCLISKATEVPEKRNHVLQRGVRTKMLKRPWIASPLLIPLTTTTTIRLWYFFAEVVTPRHKYASGVVSVR